MCGIAFVKKHDGTPAAKVAAKRYKKQSHRGSEGFGYVPIEDGYVKRVERFTEEADFLKALAEERTSEILVHHRAPTTTENLIGTTHPVVVDDEMFDFKYYLIHNGTLRNYRDLKEQHEKIGLEYNTEFTKSTLIKFKGHEEEIELNTSGFLDSEALAKEFALFNEGHKDHIDAVGGIAFVCIQTEQDGKVVAIYYGRNEDRPLIVEESAGNNGYSIIKSEGYGVEVPHDIIFRIDYDSGVCTHSKTKVGEVYRAPVYTYKDWQGRNSNYGYRLPGAVSQPIKSNEPHTSNDGGRVIQLDFGSYDNGIHLTEERAKKMTLNSLSERLDVVQEEIINHQTDIDTYEDIVLSYTDDSYGYDDAIGEIEQLNEELDALRTEYDMISREILDRGSIESPYVTSINK